MIRQVIVLLVISIGFQCISLGREKNEYLPKLSTTQLIALYESSDMVARLNARLHALEEMYPELVDTQLLAETKKAKQPIYMTQVGKGSNNILVVGAHHGREYVTSITNLLQIETLVDLAKNNPSREINRLLSTYTFYFIPILNPEGVNIALWIDEEWKANGSGVDLNRNYDTPTSPMQKNLQPASEGYYGPYPFSEYETIAIKKLCEEKDFLTLLTYHSAGEVLFWEWHQQGDLLEESIMLRDFIIKETGYEAVTSPYGWGLTDWFIETFQRPAFTPELGKTVNSKPIPSWELFKIFNAHKTLPIDVVLEMERINTNHYVDVVDGYPYHFINLYETQMVLAKEYCEQKAIEYEQEGARIVLTYKNTQILLVENEVEVQIKSNVEGIEKSTIYKMAIPMYKHERDYYVEWDLFDYMLTSINDT